jgi:hypothetical protein
VPNNVEPWLTRARTILEGQQAASEEIHFAVSFLIAVYGPQSPQLDAYTTALAQIAKSTTGASTVAHHQQRHARGVIRSVVAESEGGLITSLRSQVAGEIFAELVGLGKEILEDDTESAKNVSAVLIAAAFEDLVRRMGSELAGVAGRPKLEEIITALKNAGILKGGEVGTAQSYLKFRNDSLHADWTKVEKSVIRSCIAFIETLLGKHFS